MTLQVHLERFVPTVTLREESDEEGSVCLQLAETLTSCDLLLGLLAAATHDLDHPGVNQPFLIKTDHYLAALYKVRPYTRNNPGAQC